MSWNQDHSQHTGVMMPQAGRGGEDVDLQHMQEPSISTQKAALNVQGLMLARM